jgi:hypothetical protein
VPVKATGPAPLHGAGCVRTGRRHGRHG